MKHVPRLSAEPPLLADYRAAYPADTNADGAVATKIWNRFRDDPAYKELRDLLLARQQGLCGYCEQRLSFEKSGALMVNDQQVEHVLPKSGGQGRTLDWRNLMLSCAGGCDKSHNDPSRRYKDKNNVSCGQRKDDDCLDPNCDPRDFPLIPKLINVGLDGRLSADETACKAVGISPNALEHTINDVLNLNCERLRLARQKLVSNLLLEIEWIQKVQFETSFLTEAQKSTYLELFVAGRLQPDAHGHLHAFWTTERQYVEGLCPTWIARNERLFR